MDMTHTLMQFGLTHQEARLYECLHGTGPATGYELAKATGISRSNTYGGLSSLQEKGAAFVIDGKPVRYEAVPVAEFCGNVIWNLVAAKELLDKQLAAHEPEEETAYLTVKGEKNIRDKVRTLIENTASHIYLSMSAKDLAPFLPALNTLTADGKKVVIVTDHMVALPGGIIHISSAFSDAIRIISDTGAALTGSLTGGPAATCLFSRKENLVYLLRDSMANEIKLIQLNKQEGNHP